MNELFKALKNFIVRDIIYIIGGSSVILSFLYLSGKMCIITGEKSVFFYLFIAGISYVIGYCIQELFSLMHIVTTASYFDPWRILKKLYHCLTHRGWKDIKLTDDELDKANIVIQERAYQDIKADRERIISLMMVGTTIGPCGLISGILLLIKAVDTISNFPFLTTVSNLDLKLAIAVILISILLIILGWIKGLQLMKNTEGLYDFYKNRKFREYDP